MDDTRVSAKKGPTMSRTAKERSTARDKETSKSREKTAPAAEATAQGKLKFEGIVAREEAVAYFEAIVAGLKKGLVQFKRGDESLSLTPTSHLGIAVKGAVKDDKQEVTFKLSWRMGSDADLSVS